MPCPAFGLWVWQASPAMNTRREAVWRRRLRRVVELVAKPLANLVDRVPRDLLHLQRVGMQYPLRRGDEMVSRDVQARNPLVLVQLVELDVQADEVAAFPGNDQEAAFIGRLDRRLYANVGEVGEGEHIHHAPGLVGRISVQLPPERLTHGAAAPSQPTTKRAFTVSRRPSCGGSSRSSLTVTGWAEAPFSASHSPSTEAGAIRDPAIGVSSPAPAASASCA